MQKHFYSNECLLLENSSHNPLTTSHSTPIRFNLNQLTMVSISSITIQHIMYAFCHKKDPITGAFRTNIPNYRT